MIAVLPYSSGSEYLDISWLSGNVCAGQLDCGHRVAVDRFRAHRRPRRRGLGRCSSGSALSNFRFPRRLPHRYRRQKTHVGYLRYHLWSLWFIALGIIGGVGDIPGMAARSALVGDVSQASGKTVDYIAGLNQATFRRGIFGRPRCRGRLISRAQFQLGTHHHRSLFLPRSIADYRLAFGQARAYGRRKAGRGSR